jgi:polysaccharide deacetylase 2 family uncharacterized protein YibQ
MTQKTLVFFVIILYKWLAMAKKSTAKGRSKSKGSKYDRWVAIGIILTLIIIALSLWGPLRRFRISEEGKPAQQVKKLVPGPKKQITPEKTRRPEPRGAKQHDEVAIVAPSEKTALVAIVIDDLGQDVKPAREILSLPAKVTFAVMPGFPQSRKVAELAEQGNREVLLHLPMEYRGRNGKPAPGMLRSDMTPMDFLNTINDDVASVPGAVGVNNHEGSSLTENKEAMKFLMAELKSRDLLFLDSLTSPKSVAYATAKEFGVKAAKRDVFLDNESDNEEYIHKQLDELTRIAKAHGWAVGIGHPHPATINVLRSWISEVDRLGITIVPVSRLIQ